MTRAKDWLLYVDLQKARKVVLHHRRGEPRYELHLDRYTSSRLLLGGFRPQVWFRPSGGISVVFLVEEHPRERFEWNCTEAGYEWVTDPLEKQSLLDRRQSSVINLAAERRQRRPLPLFPESCHE